MIFGGISVDKLMEFLSKNSKEIWTLLSVLLGGAITYISTSTAEKKKNKRQMQKEKLEKILIPYCTCLESTIKQSSKVDLKNEYLYKEVNLQQWYEDLKKPVEYLDAAKRIYLSKSSRKLLEKYSEIVNLFEGNLDKEYNKCLIEYKNYLENILIEFPNIYNFMEIMIGMDVVTENKVKLAILNKSEISLLNNITGIDFIHNDEPKNYRYTSINLNDKIREIWDAINYGIMSFDDIVENEEELACILLDFINENTKNERNKLKNIIDDTSGLEELKNIYQILDEMRNKLIKEIDKIAK